MNRDESKTTVSPSNAPKEEKKVENKEYIPCKLNITPVPFRQTHAMTLLTTDEIVNMINNTFAAAFNDYYAARVYAKNGMIFADISFTPVSKQNENSDKLYCLKSKIQPDDSKGSVMSTVRRWNQGNGASPFEMTDDAKEALSVFVPTNFRNGIDRKHGNIPNINWKQACRETAQNNYWSPMANRIMYVIPIDVNVFIRNYFGSTNADGDRVLYFISILSQRVANPAIQHNMNTQYVFAVAQVAENNLREIGSSVLGTNIVHPDGFVPYR